jgi:hypothetical protein
MKSIGNHVVKVNGDDEINPNEINLNYVLNDVTCSNYFNKYNLNTLLLVYSLLGLKPQNRKEAATLLLPDSAFLGYYSGYENDNEANRKYLLDVLEQEEVYKIQSELTKAQFQRGQEVLNIKSKLWVTDSGIETMQDVDLQGLCDILNIKFDPSDLEGFFSLIEKHGTFTGTTWQKYDKSDMFSFVVTRKSLIKYSKKV